jgi:tetratricopeptide (TPR) repeat protein
MTTQEKVISEADNGQHSDVSAMVGESRAWLTRAQELLAKGNLKESEVAFKNVIALSVNAGEGYYGLGVLRLNQGDYTAAALNFQKCLELDPRNANAYYYLGEIFERWHKDLPGRALGFYQRALEINSQHLSARQKIANLQQSTTPVRQGDRGPTPTAGRSTTRSAGVYEYLQDDTSTLGKHTVTLIDSLDSLGSMTPRLSAWMGWSSRLLIRRIIGCLLITLGALILGRQVPMPVFVWPVIVVLNALILGKPLIDAIRMKTMTITFDKGRLLISAGILSKAQHNVELYRVEDIELQQTLINRLTNDGTLTLYVQSGHGQRYPLQLVGLAGIDRLRKLFDELRSLILLLRTGSWGKGIIY